MENQAFIGRSARIIATVMAVAVPASVAAGSYGTAGVSDNTVGRTTANADTVWCERIEARVTRSLFAQMNCGEVTGASSAVAGERITNPNRRTLRDFFTVRRNGPNTDPRENDDPDGPVTTVSQEPEDPNGPNGPTDPTTPTSGPVAKWDRLNDLGVTPSNFNQQSSEFQQEFQDYFEDVGGRGDWSGFNPSQSTANTD